nr:hypothetical protein [Tanacetum cinerariifolium]
GKLIQKLLLNQKCIGYLVHAYYSISPTRCYKDDPCWSIDLKSKATEDIISIGSFLEVLVLNHYVLVRKILENVDCHELIWEDFAYQIDYRKEKRSRRKKTTDESQETVDVFKESEPEPEPIKKKISSKGRVKKKFTLSADDNIISDDLDAALKLAKLNEGTGSKAGVLDEDKDITNEKVILKCGDEQDGEFSDDDNDDVEKDDKDGDADREGDDHVSDTQDADDEGVKTESDEDDIYKYEIRVRKDEDVEMKDAEVDDSNKGEKEITDAAKVDVKKTSEAKDYVKKTELPPSSSTLSVCSGFSDQFLKLSFDSSLVSTVKDYADINVSSLLDIPIKQETPQTSLYLYKSDTYHLKHATNTNTIPTPPITTDAPTIITDVHDSDALSTVELRVAKLKKDVSELKTVDHSSEALASTDKANLEEYDLKSALYQSMHANKSFNKNPTNHRLYHALMKALIKDENIMDKGVTDAFTDHKRKRDDDDEDNDNEDPPAGPNQGKTLTKKSKIGKSASAKEPVEEPIAEVVMDDVAHEVNQPQDTSEPKTRKTLNPYWFKKPPRPPTLDPE